MFYNYQVKSPLVVNFGKQKGVWGQTSALTSITKGKL